MLCYDSNIIAIGNRHRKLELRLRDENDTRAILSFPGFHTTSRKDFGPRQISHTSPLLGGYSDALDFKNPVTWSSHTRLRPLQDSWKEDSSSKSCGRWRCSEGLMNTDPTGSRHLRSVYRGFRMNSYFKRGTGQHADSAGPLGTSGSKFITRKPD
ncbi:hypothetical protein TNCV_1832931 [Trichonephila clavipes]|nr:hypothetical protein TNCV_1832931 [Trichonephila clavipes]